MKSLWLLSYEVAARPNSTASHFLLEQSLQSLTFEFLGIAGTVELIYFFPWDFQIIRALLPMFVRDFVYYHGWLFLSVLARSRLLFMCGIVFLPRGFLDS